MADFSIKRILGRALSYLIAGAMAIICSKLVQAGELPSPSYTSPTGWTTVCLGRFLIDLPPSAEFGAAKAQYKGTYGFDGINTGSAWGTLRYGEVEIVETIPAGKEGLEKMRLGAQVRITSPEAFKEMIQARKAELDYLNDRIAKSSASEAAGYAPVLKLRRDALQEIILSSKVSGFANINDPNGFGVRFGPDYVLGFLDRKDQRVRKFSGVRVMSKNDSVQGAAEEYKRMRKTYHPRAPTDIPATPGFCTYYGFIDEPRQAEMNVHMRVPIQIKQYPNLILALEMEPANSDGPRDIQKLPSMDTAHNALDKIGVKRTHGPKAVQILGTPGRSYAQEYGDNCSSTSCRPADQAYDMEARTFGNPDRVDQPQMLLLMTAATSDDYKLKRPAEPKGYNVPDRPALSGHVPPPFEIGKEIFDQVLRSIRLRPGAIAAQGSTPTATEQKK